MSTHVKSQSDGIWLLIAVGLLLLAPMAARAQGGAGMIFDDRLSTYVNPAPDVYRGDAWMLNDPALRGYVEKANIARGTSYTRDGAGLVAPVPEDRRRVEFPVTAPGDRRGFYSRAIDAPFAVVYLGILPDIPDGVLGFVPPERVWTYDEHLRSGEGQVLVDPNQDILFDVLSD